jgi:GNAT superfamily N-acetyltransferase
MLKLRRAVGAEVAELEAIVADAFGVYRPRMDREPAPMTADYRALVQAEQVWVAVEDGEIRGLIVLVPAADHLYLDTVAVRRSAQRSGVGRHLMELAETEARRRGLPAVVLCTNEVMTENLAYYPRRGYQQTHHVLEGGYRRVYFRKLLPKEP